MYCTQYHTYEAIRVSYLIIYTNIYQLRDVIIKYVYKIYAHHMDNISIPILLLSRDLKCFAIREWFSLRVVLAEKRS